MFLIWYLCFCYCASVLEGQVFRSDYTYSDQVGGWLKFHYLPSNWFEARERCQMEGAIIASPLKGELTRALTNLMKDKKVSQVFTGIHATFSQGDFFSIEGVTLDDILKNSGQIDADNKDDAENCISMFASGSLVDVKCQSVHPYVCYKEYDPLLSSQNECGTTDNEYNYSVVTGHCYKFHRIGKLWHKAYKTCAAEGGYLAIINSQKEAKLLSDLFAKFPSESMLSHQISHVANIGYRSPDNSFDWFTVHGETLSDAGYEIWAANQPANHSGVEACGAMNRFGQLDDMWCHIHAAFICEKSPQTLQVQT